MATRKRKTTKRKPARRRVKRKLTSCASKMGRKGGTVTRAKKHGIFSAAYKKKIKAAKKTVAKLHKQLKMF